MNNLTTELEALRNQRNDIDGKIAAKSKGALVESLTALKGTIDAIPTETVTSLASDADVRKLIESFSFLFGKVGSKQGAAKPASAAKAAKKTDEELLVFLTTRRKQGEVAEFLGVTSQPAKARLEKLKAAGKVQSIDEGTSVIWKHA